MPKVRRGKLAVEAVLRNREQLARLGREVRRSRERRRLTQAQLGARVGLSRPTVSAIERGLGGGHTLDTWQRLGLALGCPLRVELGRDVLEGPADAGHLAIQELVLRVARRAGWRGAFELPTKPLEPWRSTDVGLIDEERGWRILVECWNTISDLGAAVRSSDRKLADSRGLAAVRAGGAAPARVAGCWVVRASVRNRRLVSAYPELFATRFPGSSRAWVEALGGHGDPPAEPGLVWASTDASRLYAWRRPVTR
jgi:transcriptional regulator with XRE-family HTH domain